MLFFRNYKISYIFCYFCAFHHNVKTNFIKWSKISKKNLYFFIPFPNPLNNKLTSFVQLSELKSCGSFGKSIIFYEFFKYSVEKFSLKLGCRNFLLAVNFKSSQFLLIFKSSFRSFWFLLYRKIQFEFGRKLIFIIQTIRKIYSKKNF